MSDRKILVDQKCYDLAEHFLNDLASPAAKQDLAEWVQYQVELWLSSTETSPVQPLSRDRL
jgi:hypothetical protein